MSHISTRTKEMQHGHISYKPNIKVAYLFIKDSIVKANALHMPKNSIGIISDGVILKNISFDDSPAQLMSHPGQNRVCLKRLLTGVYFATDRTKQRPSISFTGIELSGGLPRRIMQENSEGYNPFKKYLQYNSTL